MVSDDWQSEGIQDTVYCMLIAVQIAAQKKQEQAAKQETAPNTAIFVSGLPLNIDNRDLEIAFGKYGLIAESVDSNKKRVVMYYDKEGKFKGEALISKFLRG